MPKLAEIIPDADVLLTMPPEQLAGHLLQILNSRSGGEKRVTIGHWTHELFEGASAPYPEQARDAVFRALAEAWNWLEVQGLIVWADEMNGPNGWRVPSRRGESLATQDSIKRYLKGTELPKGFLHPRLGETVWVLFLGGDYDTAVFQAFKEVEVAVRRAASLPETDIGVALMRKAFDQTGGPLADNEALSPELKRWHICSLEPLVITKTRNPIVTSG